MKKAYLALLAAITVGFLRKLLDKLCCGKGSLTLRTVMCPNGVGTRMALCYRGHSWWICHTEEHYRKTWRNVASRFPEIAKDMELHVDCKCEMETIRERFPDIAEDIIECSDHD